MRSITLPQLGGRLGRIGRGLSGVTAIGVKELRGRMRGRRAFIVLTVYLVLLGGFAWMIEVLQENQYRMAFAGQASYASASIGRGVFSALLLLETLLVVVLAPAFTAGAISLEREKQTLDMLATTPISSLAIVVGKLVSALVYVFILVFASIPLSALVFVFGGVAPDDILRGYVVLIATAIGIGSMALFFSALARRTQAATILAYVGVLVVGLGSIFVYYFWSRIGTETTFRDDGTMVVTGRPPEAILYLNPYFAQADVLCNTENGLGSFCDQVAYVTGRTSTGITVPMPVGPEVKPGFGGGVIVNDGGVVRMPVDDVVTDSTFGVVPDGFWPRSVLSWLGLSVIFIVLSVQMVSPTRRWRPRLPGLLRRRRDRSPA